MYSWIGNERHYYHLLRLVIVIRKNLIKCKFPKNILSKKSVEKKMGSKKVLLDENEMKTIILFVYFYQEIDAMLVWKSPYF